MILEPEAFRAFRIDSSAPSPQSGGADLRELFGVLSESRRFIGACTLAALALAGAYLAVTKKNYTATVSILVDARGRGPVGSDQSNQLNISPDATLVESQVKLLSSDTVLRRVVIRENLGADPEFVPTQPGLRATIFAAIGLGSAAPTGDDRTSRAVAAFLPKVAVKRSERTYVIDVDVATLDPQKSARLANDIAEAYIADQQDAKSDLVRRDTIWLKERVADLAERVREADNKVQKYKQDNLITDANGKLVNEQELSELTSELAKARAKTSDAKSRYDQSRAIIASGRIPDAVPDALKSTMLDRLRAQYAEIIRQDANYRTTLGDRHPALKEVQTQLRDTKNLILEEVKRISEGASNEYQLAKANEVEIQRRINLARSSTNTTNKAIVELKELERDADATRTVFERFLRARESIAADLTEGPVARVIAPASPPQAPSSPKTFAILAIALGAGLFLGAGVSLVREYLAASGGDAPADRKAAVRAGSAAARPEWRVLATLPFVGAPRGLSFNRLRDLINRRPSAPPTSASLLDRFTRNPQDALSRGIATAADAVLGQAGRAGAARAILVAGAARKVGASTVAANLAQAAAARGSRVLLIDGHRADPSLRNMVGEDVRPGLIELPGETRVIYNMDVNGSGKLFVVPILTSEEAVVQRLMRRGNVKRLDGFGDKFDLVVFDGPPICDEETRELAQAVDRIVIVADPAADLNIEETLRHLDAPRRKYAGAILNSAGRAR